MTADQIATMFFDRKAASLSWIKISGTNGEMARFWITRKQASWLMGVFCKETDYRGNDAQGNLASSERWDLRMERNGAAIMTITRTAQEPT